MSDIKLVSEEYTSKFVTGPELNTKLSEKQDKLDWYHEPEGYPYKADMAANEVTLRAGGDTSGMIGENVRLTLSENNGDNTDIKIETLNSSGGLWRNVLNASRYGEISLGDQEMCVYIKGPASFYDSVYDKNGNEITGGGSGGGGSKWISDGTDGGNTYLSLGRDENTNHVDSIFVCGPMYHEYYAAGIEFTGSWQKGGIKMKADRGGIFMNVGTPGDGENTGVIIEHDNSYRLTLSPFLCTYYNGPCVGHDIEYNNLALVGGEGGSVKIVARDISGNEKYAYIDYDNIDKLINLLNS